MNKKHSRVLSAIVISTILLLTACVSTNGTAIKQSSADQESIHGAVTAVDKYGNLATDIAASILTEKGYAFGDVFTAELGGKVLEIPFVENYSDVNRGDFLIRPSKGMIAIAMSYDNCSGKTGAVVGTKVSLSLRQKAGYLQEFELRHLVKSEDRKDYASDEIFANFREVLTAGISAKRLYRGCNPVLGDARAPYAAKLMEKADIKTVINLADSQESMAPHLSAAPYYQKLVENGQVITLNMGIDFHDPAFIAKLKDALIFMSNHDGPFYLHCNEGKDRAGMVSAVLEALMGASMQEIADDYMVSYMNYFHVKKSDAKYPVIAAIITDMFIQMNGGKPVSDTELKTVAEKYLTGTVGLTAAQVAALRKKLS